MVTGIDCSKDYFDISVLKDHKVVFEGRFNNNSIGFGQALEHVFNTRHAGLIHGNGHGILS